ncbi:MAG: arylesterase [Rhodobiaceae bacterium]
MKRRARQNLSATNARLSVAVLARAALWLALSPVLTGVFGAAQAATQAEAKPAMIEILALGDSLTAGYGLPPGDGFTPQLQAALRARGHNVRVVNGGVSGDTSSGGLARLDWVMPDSTDAVIVELGANDALRGISPEVTARNLEALAEKLQQRDLPVLLAGMLAPPNLGRRYGDAFNMIYPTLAKRFDMLHYPFFLDGVAGQKALNLADGIHPNKQGIEVIVTRILPYVETLIDQTRGNAVANRQSRPQ